MTEKKSNPFLEHVKKMTTPRQPVRYTCLAKPFYYSGSHTPRWSITLLFDQKNKKHQAFLKELEKIAAEKGIESIGYLEDKKVHLKLQSAKEPIIFVKKLNEKKAIEQKLEGDLPSYGWEAEVEFDVNIYTQKMNGKKAFTFPPSKITLFEIKTEAENENDQDSSPRPRTKEKRVRNSKLRPEEKPSVGKSLRNRKSTRKNKRA